MNLLTRDFKFPCIGSAVLLGRCAGAALFILSFVWFLFCGCGVFPKEVSLSDPELRPYLRAMAEIDREALGFTPVATNSKVYLEKTSRRRSEPSYDAMLHIYAETSRTVPFRKTGSGYRWIAEQEIHTGPGWQQTIDGNFRETILVEFQTERVNGIPTNQIWIRYSGSNSNLLNRENLTLDEIRPILAAWRGAPVEPEPPGLPDAGVGSPFLLMFLLMMLLMLLAILLLAIILIFAILALTTTLATMGIISVALFTGIMKRSVTAGFRALILMVGAIGGLALGVMGAWALPLLGASGNSVERVWIGAFTGTVMGLLGGYVINLLWRYLANRIFSGFQGKEKVQQRGIGKN